MLGFEPMTTLRLKDVLDQRKEGFSDQDAFKFNPFAIVHWNGLAFAIKGHDFSQRLYIKGNVTERSWWAVKVQQENFFQRSALKTDRAYFFQVS